MAFPPLPLFRIAGDPRCWPDHPLEWNRQTGMAVTQTWNQPETPPPLCTAPNPKSPPRPRLFEQAVRRFPRGVNASVKATGLDCRDTGMHLPVLRSRLFPAQFLAASRAACVTVNSEAEEMVCFDTLSVTCRSNLYRPGSNLESGKNRIPVACWPKM